MRVLSRALTLGCGIRAGGVAARAELRSRDRGRPRHRSGVGPRRDTQHRHQRPEHRRDLRRATYGPRNDQRGRPRRLTWIHRSSRARPDTGNLSIPGPRWCDDSARARGRHRGHRTLVRRAETGAPHQLRRQHRAHPRKNGCHARPGSLSADRSRCAQGGIGGRDQRDRAAD